MHAIKGVNNGKLIPIARKRFTYNKDMYRIIDFLNKSLKQHNIIFGMSKDGDEMIISIYET